MIGDHLNASCFCQKTKFLLQTNFTLVIFTRAEVSNIGYTGHLTGLEIWWQGKQWWLLVGPATEGLTAALTPSVLA